MLKVTSLKKDKLTQLTEITMENQNIIISIDAETDGLWGRPFAIGAIVYLKGEEVDRFYAALPHTVVKDAWVKENVLPTLDPKNITHKSYEDMLESFSEFYNENKGALPLWHMGHIVEAFLFRECVRLEFVGPWDAPYTPIEVSETLRLKGFDPASVDNYLKLENINIKGNTHNPLYDCEVAFRAWESLLSKKGHKLLD